ncbi:MAG: serine/threonine protein kinase [Lachnospiraceae bacterium]|nr:serine/threonine protein kinase [Lachnospiraceae bacterium]
MATDNEKILKGRYRLLSVAGRGGLSTVYLAEDMETGSQVALKAGDISREGILRTFLNESEILIRLDDPAVPKFIDYFEENGRCVIVTKYIPGVILSDVAVEDPVLTGMQLLFILEYLQSLDRPVLHLDLKPANVVISPTGRVCLIDFGSAVRSGACSYVRSGTPGYCAPEQLLGRTLDTRTDIYGWGMLMRNITAGTKEGETIRDILDKCTAEDPGDRYRDSKELIKVMRCMDIQGV